jgi:quercetin dioxygenase-like cupin family protein
VGQVVDELFEAVERGDDTYVVRYGEHEFPRTLVRLRTQMEHPPGELFSHIHAPTLILQGTDDMNVPPGDAAVIEEVIEDAGNPDVTRVMIDDADHSFQLIASGTDARMKDRHGFTSFYRLYHSGLYEAIEEWLGDRFPTDAPKVELWHKPRPGVVTWGGIQVVPGITDPSRNDGVDTLEGRIGPLLKAEGGQAHYIDMPPNMYVPEHPHSSESIIYVVRGRFVLASDGQRRVIEAGDLFWFRRGTPTGWEMPFDEPCYILIFKTERSPMTDFDFWVYLEGLAERLEEEARRAEEEGLSADEAQSSVEGHVDVVTTMDKLAPDHPARVFARDVNPDWERELPGSPLAE